MVHVYALVEPGSGRIRYVGKSATPALRLEQHIATGAPRVRAWIQAVGRPTLKLLSEHPTDAEALAAERAWIASLRETSDLLNTRLLAPPSPRKAPPRRPGSLARRLQGCLDSRGWTHAKLDREAKLSPGSVARYLIGHEPTLKSYRRLGAFFGVHPGELVDHELPTEPQGASQ